MVFDHSKKEASLHPVPEGVEENVSLQKYNSFGVEALARYFVNVSSEKQLQALVKTSFYKSIPLKRILGGGSNVLFTGNFEGLIIRIDIRGKEVIKNDSEHVWVEAGGGENWHKFVEYCLEKNFGGIENLSLIPGTVGAAPVQNIGAYGVELSEVFSNLKAIDLNTGELVNFNKNDCSFAYRHSVFKGELKFQYAITRVTFKLQKNPVLRTNYASLKEAIEMHPDLTLNIKNVSHLVCKVRQSKLPDPKKTGNAGSFFKNPIVSSKILKKIQNDYPDVPYYRIDEDSVKIPAGWLIEKTGMKGIRMGNAGTWPEQALVIINLGNATGNELKNFSGKIQQKVLDKFGIKLNNEVNIW